MLFRRKNAYLDLEYLDTVTIRVRLIAVEGADFLPARFHTSVVEPVEDGEAVSQDSVLWTSLAGTKKGTYLRQFASQCCFELATSQQNVFHSVYVHGQLRIVQVHTELGVLGRVMPLLWTDIRGVMEGDPLLQ